MVKPRKVLLFCVKLAVTVGVLIWVVSKIHWHDYAVTTGGQAVRVFESADGRLRVASDSGTTWRSVSEFEPLEGQVVRPGFAAALGGIRVPVYLLGAALFVVNLTGMGVRWWYLLRFGDIRVTLGRSTRLMFVGQFFNFFLPGSTGGDLLRAYLVTKETKKRTVALAILFLDRFIGLAGLSLLAGVGTLLSWGRLHDPMVPRVVGLIVLGVVAAGVVVFSRGVGRLLRLERIIRRLPRRENLSRAVETAYTLGESPGTLLAAFAVTAVIHLSFVAGVAAVGSALGLPIPLYLYVVFLPVIYIIGSVPVSIAGLGVIEGLYIVLFCGASSVAASSVLALALLARLTPMAVSLPGLFFWWTTGRGTPPTEPAPEHPVG